MHGSTDQTMTEPIKGQENIHKKIKSLNFEDCRARIWMVDAHATLSDGVVIQVNSLFDNKFVILTNYLLCYSKHG